MKNLTVEDWALEIDRCFAYRRQYGVEDGWAKLEAMFYNTHPSAVVAGPNIISSNGDSLLSSLSVPFPYILIKATKIDCLTKAPIKEALANQLIDDLELGEEVEQAILSGFLWGRGIIKIGYDSEHGYSLKDDIGPLMGMEGPMGMTLTVANKKGNKIEFGPGKPGQAWAKMVLPHDFLVPYGTGPKLDTAPYVIHRVVRHIDDIKGDTKYSNVKNLEPMMSMEDFVKSYTSVTKPYRVGQIDKGWYIGTDSSRNTEYVELFEIRDKRTGRIQVVATGHDKFLRNEEDLLTTEEGFPFVSFSFTPTARSFWVTSDAQYLLAIQEEATDISLQKTKQRRISTMKIASDGDAIDDLELQKALSPEVGAVFKLKPGHKVSEALQPIQMGNNELLHREEEFNRRNAREVIGMSSNQLGEFDRSSRRTASEALIVDQASQRRSTRRQTMIARTYVQTMRKIFGILERHWKMPQLVKYLGESGAEEWVKVNGPYLKGSYSYSVSFSNQPPETLEQRKSNALGMVVQLAQIPWAQLPPQLIQFLLRAFNDPGFTSIFAGVSNNGQSQGASTSASSNSSPTGSVANNIQGGRIGASISGGSRETGI